MPRTRDLNPSSVGATALSTLALVATALFGTACPTGDVGAPCNHGTVEPPQTRLVTFPALSCNDLLCVFGEEPTIPTTDCAVASDCNDAGESVFECNVPEGADIGTCRISIDYVLERSMCSKACQSDEDCENTGAGNRPVDEDTACSSGFECTVLQQLGEFCCEKLCVCKDDLPDLADLRNDCESGAIDCGDDG